MLCGKSNVNGKQTNDIKYVAMESWHHLYNLILLLSSILYKQQELEMYHSDQLPVCRGHQQDCLDQCKIVLGIASVILINFSRSDIVIIIFNGDLVW